MSPIQIIEGIEKKKYILKSHLGDEVANIVLNKYGTIDYEWGIKNAATDFVRHLYLRVIISINVF